MPLLKPIRGLQLNTSHPFAHGLVACWLMNEGCGGTVFDSSGNNNVGTLYGDTYWNAGRFGASLHFDGTGDYVNVSDTDSLDINDSITVSALIKLNNLGTYKGIVAKDSGIWNGSANYQFLVNSSNKLEIRWEESSSGKTYSVLSTALSAERWYHVAFQFSRNANNTYTAKIYVDGIEKSLSSFKTEAGDSGWVAVSSTEIPIIPLLNTNPVRIGVYGYPGASQYFNGSIDDVKIYNRALSAGEIAHLYREPLCMFEQETRQAFLFVPTINLAGTSGAQSSTTATAKLTRRIKGLSAAATDVTATMKIVGEALLNGSTDVSSVLSGKLTLRYRGPWLSKILKIERQWLTGALFNGMTANAFKLGVVMSCGWFWMRPNGCTVLYRGTAMEKIDFTNIMSVAEQNAESMSLPDYVPQNNSSTYFYVVRRFNNCGYQELTLYAAVKVAIDAEGNLAEPLHNHIFAWRAGQMDGNKAQLVWFYSPLEQKSKPVRFEVYYDGGTGQIDYENPIAAIDYRGRKFYCWQSEALTTGRYLFAVKPEDAGGIQNNSSAKIAIEIVSDTPDAIEILKVETM